MLHECKFKQEHGSSQIRPISHKSPDKIFFILFFFSFSGLVLCNVLNVSELQFFSSKSSYGIKGANPYHILSGMDFYCLSKQTFDKKQVKEGRIDFGESCDDKAWWCGSFCLRWDL